MKDIIYVHSKNLFGAIILIGVERCAPEKQYCHKLGAELQSETHQSRHAHSFIQSMNHGTCKCITVRSVGFEQYACVLA